MKRVGVILAGAILLALLPFGVSGCAITCGCSSTPDPNWTPPPITADEAATYAAKAAGAPFISAQLRGGLSGRPFYEADAANAVAFVDAESGLVLEVVLEDRMPNDDAVSVARADAQTAAEAFLHRTGMSTEGFTESAQVVHQAGIAAYEVDWNDPTKFQILVNASSGSVFAFVDLRMQLNLIAPIVGQARATDLAVAALGVPGETVTSVDLTIDFTASGSQVSAWAIGLGVPTATQADLYEHGALVSVDAVTGQATIVKS
jgi:uncharacterized membrane protein YkoI